jgi:hypothetical protein
MHNAPAASVTVTKRSKSRRLEEANMFHHQTLARVVNCTYFLSKVTTEALAPQSPHYFVDETGIAAL